MPLPSVELIDLSLLDPTLKLDVRYAREDNFLGRRVYPSARAFLQKPAAESLLRAHRRLASEGAGLLIFDGYRPWSVTKLFWELTPEEKHRFVANPATGSRHNRGAAIDLSLYSLSTGLEIAMPSAFDEMNERASPDYAGGTAEQREARDLLRSAMEAEDFTVNRYEWWHFDHSTWKNYPVLDLSFDEIDRGAPPRLAPIARPEAAPRESFSV